MEVQVSPEAVAASRRAAGVKLGNLAQEIVRLLPEGRIYQVDAQMPFLTPKEVEMLDKVAGHLIACENALLKMSSKLREAE